MHASSYDRMAEFCHDYLAARRNEALTIVDLGSCDYNGSYRPIFARSPGATSASISCRERMSTWSCAMPTTGAN